MKNIKTDVYEYNSKYDLRYERTTNDEFNDNLIDFDKKVERVLNKGLGEELPTLDGERDILVLAYLIIDTPETKNLIKKVFNLLKDSQLFNKDENKVFEYMKELIGLTSMFKDLKELREFTGEYTRGQREVILEELLGLIKNKTVMEMAADAIRVYKGSYNPLTKGENGQLIDSNVSDIALFYSEIEYIEEEVTLRDEEIATVISKVMCGEVKEVSKYIEIAEIDLGEKKEEVKTPIFKNQPVQKTKTRTPRM